MAGPRDSWFFDEGWSGVVVEGNVTTRFARNGRATLRSFARGTHLYGLTLRGSRRGFCWVATERGALTERDAPRGSHARRNPERTGSMKLRPCRSRDHGRSAPRSAIRAAFKLWYVQIVPQGANAS